MEECDALCTRLAIMVNGRFMCIGSPQHLKNKFGQGYTLVARLAVAENSCLDAAGNLQQFLAYIEEKFPLSNIFDDHQGYVHFQIPKSDVSLAQVFGVMEQARKDYNVDDYSVHQTTLEQVFLTFTRMQVASRPKNKSSLCKSKTVCCCCH